MDYFFVYFYFFFFLKNSVLWTVSYDTIYAHQDKADDAALGLKSTAIWGACLAAAPSLPAPGTFFLLALGAGLARSAGCAANDLWDRRLDARVERTKKRPLASGEMSAGDAVVTGGAAGAAALACELLRRGFGFVFVCFVLFFFFFDFVCFFVFRCLSSSADCTGCLFGSNCSHSGLSCLQEIYLFSAIFSGIYV